MPKTRVIEVRPYDVFLSHSTADKRVVKGLAHRLLNAGLKPFLDKWHLIPGDPWQEAIDDALNKSSICVVCVGPEGITSWQHEEMRTALAKRVENSDFRVIPLLLPGASHIKTKDLPPSLQRLSWVDCSLGVNESTLHRLISGIRGEAPGPAQAVGLAARAVPVRHRGQAPSRIDNDRQEPYGSWSTLQEAISGLHGSAPLPLARYLTDVILEQIAEEMRGVEFDAKQFSITSGFRDYRSRIHSIIGDEENSNMTILAVCGEKGLKDDDETFDYFKPFLNFPKTAKHQVYRAFVARATGRLHLAKTDRIIRLHEDADGVCPLNVSRSARKTFDENYRGICEQLDEGFGYVIFVISGNPFAVVHRGVKELLTYAEFNSPAAVFALIRLTQALYKASEEYRQAGIKQEIDEMFERILVAERSL